MRQACRLSLRTLLEEAASAAAVVARAATSPAEVAQLGADGLLPIHYAASRNAPRSVLVALAGADGRGARRPRAGGKLPHHFAAQHDAVDALAALRELHPAGVAQHDGEGRLPLHVAAAAGASGAVAWLLAIDPDGAAQEDAAGMLPLHQAAMCQVRAPAVRPRATAGVRRDSRARWLAVRAGAGGHGAAAAHGVRRWRRAHGA